MKYRNGRTAIIGDEIVGIAGGKPCCGLLVGPAQNDQHLIRVAHLAFDSLGDDTRELRPTFAFGKPEEFLHLEDAVFGLERAE